jgi:D-alanyl-D-alanine carboxypeptidase/D-alanyl-D-alanine-endopeptidase (penicillin-binding protein 4)
MHKAGFAAVAVVLAAAAATQAGLIPRVGAGAGSATVQGTVVPPGPALRIARPAAADDVLDAVGEQSPLSVSVLREHLRKALAQQGFGPRFGFAVAPLGSSQIAWSEGASVVTPASTMKLLTTTAALKVLGPEHRFTTTVVEGPTPGSIVLVGGGDPLLAATAPKPATAQDSYPTPATLAALADKVTAQLLDRGVTRVHLGYDATLFSGPAVNPHWPATYIPEDVVSPIAALWVNEGRDHPGFARRSADPAAAAAADFARLLDRDGVKVVGPAAEQSAPPPPQTLVASVTSPPLEEIVQHVLELSDNEAAEVLLRQVAIATGRLGSFTAGVTAVRQTLAGLGLDVSGGTFYDGSGLSREDRLPIDLLVRVLQTAASPSHPALRGVISGLPVAGFSGSLGYRFVDDAKAGLGYVRAKTGTLTGVHGLAGLVTTRGGQVLVFASVADRVPIAKTLDARADLDRLAAALATCSC